MTEPKILYSRTAKDAVNTWYCFAEGPEVVTVWGQEGGQQQTARFTCEPKNEGKKNATTAEQQAVKEVKALYARKQKEKYSPDRDTAGETTRIKPLLAGDWAKHKSKISWPATCQAKLDGVRMLAMWSDGKVVLQSRRGDFYKVEHISKELETRLPKGLILDGELYIHGTSLQTITSLVRRPQLESRALQYWVYDTVVEDTPWVKRMDILRSFFYDSESVIFHMNRLCKSEEEVIQAQIDFVEMGYEGAIVRNHKGLYREGYRSPDLLKVKSFLDGEYKIIGFKVGKGKFENVPVFRCVTEEGKEFDCSPKGTAEDRAQMLKEAPNLTGQFLKVRYFNFTDSGVPHFPVGLAIRMKEDMP